MTTATQLLKSFTPIVTPAKAGVQFGRCNLDSGLRRNDGEK